MFNYILTEIWTFDRGRRSSDDLEKLSKHHLWKPGMDVLQKIIIMSLGSFEMVGVRALPHITCNYLISDAIQAHLATLPY